MPRYRATTGWERVPSRAIPSLPVTLGREPIDLHIVETDDDDPFDGVSLCGLGVEIIDSHWRRGLGRCTVCISEASARDQR